jgi:type I protein arginine methyltransferase
VYSIADYGAMISDKVRMDAFVQALRDATKPGAVVVDIGTGTGIFAMLACRFGARRVYAIDPEDAIEVAREIASANGCADRIEFIQAMSTRVTLPERADVIISDLGDMLPWYRRHIPSIVDARARFLGPGGVLIPQRDVAWCAVVEAPDLYAKRSRAWDANGFGLDMSAARRIVVNTWSHGRVTSDNLLTDPARWATLDHTVVEDPDVNAHLRWTVTRSGTGHGLSLGFDRTVADGICISNAPDAPESTRHVVYGTVFLPWLTPVVLAEGDIVTVDLNATLIREDYVWTWNTRVLDRGPSGAEKAAFQQSTFYGMPLSNVALRKKAGGYVPTLTEDGQIVRFVIDAIDGQASVDEIARRVSAEFPGRFPRPCDALSYVADLSRQFG